MTVAVATIGSYILENTHEEDELCQPPFKRPKSASNDPSRLPSLLCECVVAATNDTTIHTQPQQQCMTTRILLTQDESPGSRLVCSSLILDLALSLTSNCFCRCHRTRDIPIDNPEDRTPDGTREECHGCLAVVILKPFCGNPANATSNGDVFPMLCQRRYREWDPTPSTTGQEATAATTTTQSRCDRHGCSSSIQDSRTPAFATTCRRIQIRRVRSVQEVQRYLLSLLGLPRRDQPVGGILIDGFDQIVELGVEQEDLPATGVTEPAKTIRMTQAVALLMDTAQCLDRWHEHFPTTLIAMRRDDSALQALSFWLSNTLHLSTMPLSANTNDFATSDGDDEVSVTNWRITKVASGGTRILAKLAVVGNHCHDLRVVWSTCG